MSNEATTVAVNEWAEDFDGVWHRMSSDRWERGVGPADPVACCGRKIDSVSHSTFHPREMDGGREFVCASGPDVVVWRYRNVYEKTGPARWHYSEYDPTPELAKTRRPRHITTEIQGLRAAAVLGED